MLIIYLTGKLKWANIKTPPPNIDCAFRTFFLKQPILNYGLLRTPSVQEEPYWNTVCVTFCAQTITILFQLKLWHTFKSSNQDPGVVNPVAGIILT